MWGFNWLTNWRKNRRRDKELKALAEIEYILKTEEKEVKQLTELCEKMRVLLDEHKFDDAIQVYRDMVILMKKKKTISMMEKMDFKKLKKSIFKDLKSHFEQGLK